VATQSAFTGCKLTFVCCRVPVCVEVLDELVAEAPGLVVQVPRGGAGAGILHGGVGVYDVACRVPLDRGGGKELDDGTVTDSSLQLPDHADASGPGSGGSTKWHPRLAAVRRDRRRERIRRFRAQTLHDPILPLKEAVKRLQLQKVPDEHNFAAETYVADGNIEVLVPTLYGEGSATRKAQTSSQRVWEKQSLLDALERLCPDGHPLVRRLYDLAAAGEPSIGRGLRVPVGLADTAPDPAFCVRGEDGRTARRV